MIIKKNVFFCTVMLYFVFAGRILPCFSSDNTKQEHPPYLNPELSVEERINDLVSRMTLEEKISQMRYDAPAIERLNIPQYNWWNECLHGVARAGRATVFPQAIGLAATWDTDLMHQVATVISDEARAKYHHAVKHDNRSRYYGLTFWSPNINIFRDPRWGRGQETYGEDPYLTSQMGISFVKGLQSNDPAYFKVIATPKHYAVHSGPEPERHHFNAVVNQRVLWDTYLPAFEACIIKGKAYSVMGAYNRTNGEPCCASPVLLQEILRNAWNFEGYVVSDCWAIQDIHANHHYVDTAPEAAAVAVKSGCDLNCGNHYPFLLEAVQKGLITEELIDTSVKRLFRARFKLGMFDPDDMVPYTSIPYEIVDCKEHRELARKTARASIVLLKNQDNLLPLQKNLSSIAVIGPNADNIEVLNGNYHGTSSKYVTILQGIKNTVSENTVVRYTRGCDIAASTHIPLKIIPSSHLIPDKSTKTKGLKGEYFSNMNVQGEPVMTRYDSTLDFSWNQSSPAENFPSDNFSVRWTGYLTVKESGKYTLGLTGDDGYRLYINDNKIIDLWSDHSATTTTSTVTLEKDKLYPIRIEYYENSGGASLTLAWNNPRITRQIQKERENELRKAVQIVSKSEAAVVVGGISPQLEGEEMQSNMKGFQGGDRTDIMLPEPQIQLLKALRKIDTPVILILLSGSALAVNWADSNIPAILEAWYPGEEGGHGVADVIFGAYNPSARLPVTFYRSIDQLPPFDDYSMKNHTYRYFKGEVLYPFGYGLSYTDFEYSNLNCSSTEISLNENITVSVDIANIGKMDGDEVVQVYISDLESSYPVPIKSLRDFKRINIKADSSKKVTFNLNRDDFSTVNNQGKRIVEPGEFEIMVGKNSLEGLKTKVLIK
ncbi:MAG: glycoside hydrolase family 3 C-terminal domain-containing protein [bacterium]